MRAAFCWTLTRYKPPEGGETASSSEGNPLWRLRTRTRVRLVTGEGLGVFLSCGVGQAFLSHFFDIQNIFLSTWDLMLSSVYALKTFP
ncbi:hypothetical protein BZZ01_26860 [Nostocales cyanobacterium HT-58-2]|nr:hypothetical protein BZZ01_26860 [Nostocales cyanobacterium HT-58-2]